MNRQHDSERAGVVPLRIGTNDAGQAEFVLRVADEHLKYFDRLIAVTDTELAVRELLRQIAANEAEFIRTPSGQHGVEGHIICRERGRRVIAASWKEIEMECPELLFRVRGAAEGVWTEIDARNLQNVNVDAVR